jgi:hypothetical protein
MEGLASAAGAKGKGAAGAGSTGAAALAAAGGGSSCFARVRLAATVPGLSPDNPWKQDNEPKDQLKAARVRE